MRVAVAFGVGAVACAAGWYFSGSPLVGVGCLWIGLLLVVIFLD